MTFGVLHQQNGWMFQNLTVSKKKGLDNEKEETC